MASADPLAKFEHFLSAEFDDSPATPAYHVIMRALPEGVFVMGLLDLKTHLLEYAAFHEERKRPVDGGLADFLPAVAKQVQHLLGLEMLVEIEDGIENLATGSGVFDAPFAQKLAECGVNLFRSMQVVQVTHGSRTNRLER